MNKEQQAIAVSIQSYFDHIPEIYRRIYRKAMKGNSLRAAINAKCQDCMNWQRAEIRDCNIVTCPLWPYRPYQVKSGTKNPLPKAILAQNI